MRQQTNQNPEIVKGFLAFIRNEVKRQQCNGHMGVAKNYSCAFRSFSQFLADRGQDDISFRNLTRQIMSDYESWLQSRGLCKNSTSCYIRSLQATYNRAVRQGITENQDPFRNTYRGVARTVKRAISHDDIHRIYTLDIHATLCEYGNKDRSRRLVKMEKQLEFARDIFIFCFCSRGMTFIDFAHLRKADISGNIISYVRRKTHQRMIVQIEPIMQQIIDRYPSSTIYQFPLLTATDDAAKLFRQYRYAIGWYNTNLTLLGRLIGGVHITSYVSRHSWATAAYHLHLPLSVISQSMGHDSEKTTEIYLKSLESAVIDDANRNLIDSVFGKG